jgi:hypothetical protein
MNVDNKNIDQIIAKKLAESEKMQELTDKVNESLELQKRNNKSLGKLTLILLGDEEYQVDSVLCQHRQMWEKHEEKQFLLKHWPKIAIGQIVAIMILAWEAWMEGGQ